ncbi:MAG: DNA repair protein RadC [Candidatus Hydrothermarchaeales archaeon]
MRKGVVEYKIRIKDLPEEERPRERLVKFGAEALSTSELLAIILRSGSPGCTVIELSNKLLSRYDGNLKSLFSATVNELSEIDGIKMAKAAQIKACFELGKRLAAFTENVKPVIQKPEDVASLFMSEMRYLDKEYFKGLFLDSKNKILKEETISIGSLNANIVHPREVFKRALSYSAASIVLVHNHPSGDPSPSNNDIEITEKLIVAGKLMGIELLDHIVIGDGQFKSLKREGLID